LGNIKSRNNEKDPKENRYRFLSNANPYFELGENEQADKHYAMEFLSAHIILDESISCHLNKSPCKIDKCNK